MAKIDKARIVEILADADFAQVIEHVRSDLTKTVMAFATPDEDRSRALAEHHALDRVLTKLRKTAQP